jgi:hypothetical protein
MSLMFCSNADALSHGSVDFRLAVTRQEERHTARFAKPISKQAVTLPRRGGHN